MQYVVNAFNECVEHYSLPAGKHPLQWKASDRGFFKNWDFNLMFKETRLEVWVPAAICPDPYVSKTL